MGMYKPNRSARSRQVTARSHNCTTAYAVATNGATTAMRTSALRTPGRADWTVASRRWPGCSWAMSVAILLSPTLHASRRACHEFLSSADPLPRPDGNRLGLQDRIHAEAERARQIFLGQLLAFGQQDGA